MLFVYNFIDIFTRVVTIAIFIRAVLSWFPMPPGNPVSTIVNQVTDPILMPLRRVIPTLGMMDITPMVAIILLQVISEMAKAMVLRGALG
ncbi:MAG: YggT family protein [Dehalococcoidia bacterium]|nr:YggT family protein [Dehalococcoidia bacterium]